MDKKYIVEAGGTMVIVTTLLLAEANPVMVGLVYFAVHWIGNHISTGFFTPFGPLAAYMLGRGDTWDIIYNYIAQYTGAIAAILLYKPLKTYI